MKEIKRIDPGSLAKIAALFGVIWGLLMGVLFLILRTAAVEFTGRVFLGFEKVFPIVVGVAAIVLLPILYGITGYIGGYIVAYIYNFIVEKFGGVKIDLK
jgi:hypothetical protein